jgi:hypothetical protein
MSGNISKREVILSLYKAGKTLDEIQATIIIMFEHEPIPSIDVNIFLVLSIILKIINILLIKSIKMMIVRENKKEGIFQFDKRKKKKVCTLATLLIEHLTEESNGHITAAAIKIKLKRILGLNLHKSTVQRVRHKYLGFN